MTTITQTSTSQTSTITLSPSTTSTISSIPSTSITFNTEIESSTNRTTTHHADLGIPRSESLLPPGTIHDEVEIEDFQFNPETGIFTYPCPCGDLFQITVDELKMGETLAKCPSCSLVVKVVYDPDDFDFNSDDEDEDED